MVSVANVAVTAAVSAKVDSVTSTIKENTSLSVSAKANFTAGPKEGVQFSATADRESLSEGNVTVAARTSGGGIAATVSATANVDIGPKDIGQPKLTASVRAGLVGGTVNVGEKGVNGQVSFGPQIGVTYKASNSPVSTGVGGSTTFNIPSYVHSFVSAMDACSSSGC